MSDQAEAQSQVLQAIRDVQDHLAKLRTGVRNDLSKLQTEQRGLSDRIDGRMTTLEQAVRSMSERLDQVDRDVQRLRHQVSDQHTLDRSMRLASLFSVPPMISDLALKGAAFRESDKERSPSSHYGQ